MNGGLTELPGIGEKISSKLISHFGSEQKALEVLIKRDVASLAEVPGISEKYAISIIHEMISSEEGVSPDDFLKTNEAMNVYERLIGLIRSYSHTTYSRSKLSTYFPYPSRNSDSIRSIQSDIKKYIELAQKISRSKNDELDTCLKRVRNLKAPSNVTKSRDRVIVADNKKDFETLKNNDIDHYLDISHVDNFHELIDLARGYSQTLVLGNKFTANDLPEDVSIEFVDDAKDIWWLVPEVTIGFFAANKEPVESALEVIKLIRSRSGFELCTYLNDQAMAELSGELSMITPDGELVLGVDQELDRLKDILKRFNDVLKSVLKKANNDLSERMEKSTVTLKGSQLLGMFGEKGADSGLKNMLEKEVNKAYAEVIGESKETIKKELSLRSFEMQHVDLMFNDEVVYPIEINYRGVESFKNAINKQLVSRSLEMKRSSAKKLSKYEKTCKDVVKDMLEFDMYYAIGLFSVDYELRMPKLTKKAGINLQNARNIFIGGPSAKKVEPVNYSVGVKNPETKAEKVVILSGVNSGGKTTMLDLIAQVTILAHMGFPVPAESAEIGLVDELLYFSKSKGTLSAGAFETTIKDFSTVISKNSKVVLVDELESITEPGASARIIAGILETLHDNDNCMAVFVSHLAEQILKNTKYPIRIDGIEAKGLDANLNLIVDRTPRYNYLAKSTPELIVERLTKLSDGEKKEFYTRLLNKFKQNN
ncbi:DNA mismatch repair protein [Methanocella sp. CWC-04]|uniref:DNA-binding protein MutS2 n=1 Tax=Methanooceanicella nereidis TaxID=2052831 RepID=A0AAP2W810_9EURY|nr:DNA mismatch repair protein [Methanocella sp. CWC-04]